MFGWIDNYVMGIFVLAERLPFFDRDTALDDIFAARTARIFDRIVSHFLGGLIPIHLGDFVGGTEVFVGITVAIETPPHAQGFVLIDSRHLIDATVATGTSDTCGDVYAVIKVRIIGEHMNTHPRNRLARFVALADKFKFGAFGEDLGMASHAHRRRRHSGVCGFFDGRMAVAAIHAQFSCVQFVAERNGLDGRIADVRKLGGKPIPHTKGCKSAPRSYKCKQC